MTHSMLGVLYPKVAKFFRGEEIYGVSLDRVREIAMSHDNAQSISAYDRFVPISTQSPYPDGGDRKVSV